ncbi:hypothetical protein ACHAWX_003827 [Stephanocyclus meneghinianus]
MKLRSINASMAFLISASSLHNASKAATARARKLGCGTRTFCRRSRSCFVHDSTPFGHKIRTVKPWRSRTVRYDSFSIQRSQRIALSAAPSGTNRDSQVEIASSRSSSSNRTANPISTRRADDYDSAIFAPSLTKGSDNSRDTTGDAYGSFNSDYYSDQAPDNSSIPNRLKDQTNNQQQKVTTESDDVAAFRARYQFRFNPRRGRPPPMSVYDDDDFFQSNYNWFDDDNGKAGSKETHKNDSSEGGSTVLTTVGILEKERASTSEGWSEGGTIVKRSARILQSQKSSTFHPVSSSSSTPTSSSSTASGVVRTTARILPNTTNNSEHPTALLSQTPATNKTEKKENFNVGEISHRTFLSRNFVPSFMEPEKTKAMIYNSDESERISGERLTPSMPEASNGSSSTPYSTTLLYQIQHLTSQIYQLNNGVEFNIDSPKQVSRVLFGEDGISTSKDALEALASGGNRMAACIFKYRKTLREYKREIKRTEQMEKGDRKNDYYGNLARKAVASNSTDVEPDETVDIRPHREPLLLIDASAYIFRAYHAIPPLHHSDGTPTGALHGVCRMLQNLLLNRLLRGDRPRIVLVFDSKGANFRHDLYPEYKANRGPCPDDLVPQFELVREAAEAFGVVQVEAEGYEADDVIATLTLRALEEGVDVDILSGDKDLMQLITPP